MSARSFRDRYTSILGAGTCQPQAVPSPDWPLPQGARQTDTPDGPCVVHDCVFGGEQIADAAAVFGHRRRAGGSGSFPDDALFLDTETTGLSGGTGTHVFLVGVGRFQGDGLHVRQFFMRYPGDEPALLSAVLREVRHAGALVTYNGRSFDVPLLEARFRMHGRAFDRPDEHVDLLPPARAIWKHRLPSCSLATIEQAILGVARELDVPGWMIPQLYFDYLRSRRIELLEPVFAHNRSDIVSLARLTALVHAYEAGIEAPSNDIDRIAVALYRLRKCPTEAAIADLTDLWHTLTIPSDLRLRALRQLSAALKRQGRQIEACELWQQALSDPSRAIRLYAAEELAKHLEHRERDHQQARAVAQRGADGAALARDEVAVEAFQRRLRRLERKLLAAEQRRARQG